MAVNKSDYPIQIDTGIWTTKDYNKYLLFFRYKKKLHKKVLNLQLKNWNKRDKKKYATAEMLGIKINIDNNFEIKSNIILGDYIKEYFSYQSKTEYLEQKKRYYKNHLEKSKIHKMKIKDIISKDIKEVIFSFNEMSERTKKTTIEILNPVFKEAIEERICIYNPCDNIKIKIAKNKKIILNARDELKKVIEAVEELFKEDDFYYCLFSFYIQGRRKSEVLKMLWKNIDIKNSAYVIEDVKNGENQKFFLSENISSRIENIPKRNKYIFASNTKNDDHIKNIRGAVKKIRDLTNTDFTLKDTRNIITSAMGQNGASTNHQSGTLGHRSMKTIDIYSTLNYEIGSKKASELIEDINS